MHNGSDGINGRDGSDGINGPKAALNYSQYFNNSQELENHDFLELNTKMLLVGSSITLNGTNKFDLTSGTYQVNFRVIVEDKCLISFDDTYSVRNDNDNENILNLSFIYTTDVKTTVGLKITELTTESITSKFAQLTIIKIKGNIFYPQPPTNTLNNLVITDPPTTIEYLPPINQTYPPPRPESDDGFLSCSIS